MTEQGTGLLGRYGRYLWGGAALLLLLVLVGSVVLSGSSVGSAEADAEARAESLSSSVIEEELTPDLLARDITGTSYRDLTVRVQAGILSDDRNTTVRIWRLDGALIYSTAQKDDESVIAADDAWIAQALDGKTVSVLSSAGTYHDGLKRPTEELFQTFVPITLPGDDVVDAVLQIDQRYSAIHNQAYRLWRPLQFVALILLIGVAVMFVRWLRQAPASFEHAPPTERRLGSGRRAEDRDVSDVMARAERAERTARETKERLRELEAAVAAAPSTATATAALEELDLKLRASEAEREELAATVQRLQTALTDRDAEVALVRDGSGSRADTKRINKLIADAESKVMTADRKAAAAEKKTQEAAKRATVSAERALELEAQLKEAEQKATDAQKLAATVDKRGSGAEKKIADAERRALEREKKAKEAVERAAQAERQARELAGQAADAEERAAVSEQRGVQAEERMAAGELRVAEAERKVADAAQLVAQAEGRASDAEKLAAKIELRAAEAERRAADAEQRALQAEQRAAVSLGDEAANSKRRDSGDRKMASELKRAVGERDQLVAKLAELERAFVEAQAKIETTERGLAVANLQLTNSADATASAKALEERALAAEVRFADSEERVTDAQSRLADAEAKLADALAKLEEATTGSAAPLASFGSGNGLEARIAELESARRADVVELQRAQEAFGNTQVELANATRKLKEAEARVSELERGGTPRPAPTRVESVDEPAPVPSYVAAAGQDQAPPVDADDSYPPVEAFGDGGAPHTWETTSLPPQPAPEDEPPEEGLSLRERLARAAAGRKRLS